MIYSHKFFPLHSTFHKLPYEIENDAIGTTRQADFPTDYMADNFTAGFLGRQS